MTKAPEQVSVAFVEEMRAHWGADLSAVVLYGSAVRDDFVPGRSDLNFMVLVRDLEPLKLAGLQRSVRAWRREKIAAPIFIQTDMLPTSLDSYPLEFLTMKAAYKVLFGDDPLESLSFEREAVRLQCERELRGKLIHLRAELIESEGKADRLHGLIRASLPAFTAIFQGLLFVTGQPHERWGTDLVEAAKSFFDLDAELFHELGRVKRARRAPGRDDLRNLLAKYLREIERLTRWIDMEGTRQG